MKVCLYFRRLSCWKSALHVGVNIPYENSLLRQRKKGWRQVNTEKRKKGMKGRRSNNRYSINLSKIIAISVVAVPITIFCISFLFPMYTWNPYIYIFFPRVVIFIVFFFVRACRKRKEQRRPQMTAGPWRNQRKCRRKKVYRFVLFSFPLSVLHYPITLGNGMLHSPVDVVEFFLSKLKMNEFSLPWSTNNVHSGCTHMWPEKKNISRISVRVQKKIFFSWRQVHNDKRLLSSDETFRWKLKR